MSERALQSTTTNPMMSLFHLKISKCATLDFEGCKKINAKSSRLFRRSALSSLSAMCDLPPGTSVRALIASLCTSPLPPVSQSGCGIIDVFTARRGPRHATPRHAPPWETPRLPTVESHRRLADTPAGSECALASEPPKTSRPSSITCLTLLNSESRA